MNFILQIVARTLLKGLGPIDGYKTIAGLGIAVASYVADAFFGVEVPVLGHEATEMIGMLVAAFGLGDKGRKSGGKAVAR